MRLNQYMISEGRSTPFDMEKNIEKFKKDCSETLKCIKKHTIFRGIKSREDFLFVQPSKSTRISKNTGNLYTIIMDNSPNWKGFPKRSKSLICTTKAVGAEAYGNVYRVIPVNGANIGICPEADIWFSFDATHDLSDVVKRITLAGEAMGVDFKGYVDINHVKKMFKEIDAKWKKGEYKDESKWKEARMYRWFAYDYKGDMLETIEGVLDPVYNEFKHTKNICEIPTKRVEVWTDADCYLIEESLWKEFNKTHLGRSKKK